jgi:hypothetical protein
MSDSDEPDLKTLARELRHVRDRLAITDCIHRYGRALDRLDHELLRGTYHEDGVSRHGPFIGNREEFVPWGVAAQANFAMTHHSITTHSCEIDGDRAFAESYCIFYVVMPDQRHIGGGTARYVDELERRDGTWALSKRVEIMDFCYQLERSDWIGEVWFDPASRRDRGDLSYQRPLDIPNPEAASDDR